MPDVSASNSAHLRNISGSFVASIRSPYDRQLLREHAEVLAGRTGALLILGESGTQWIIRRGTLADSRCTTCTQFLGRLSCSRRDETDPTCIDCAMQYESSEQMEEVDA